jgi:hypothetical protein
MEKYAQLEGVIYLGEVSVKVPEQIDQLFFQIARIFYPDVTVQSSSLIFSENETKIDCKNLI